MSPSNLFARVGAAHRIRQRLYRRRVPQDLSPHMLRDIGLEPGPEAPPIALTPRW